MSGEKDQNAVVNGIGKCLYTFSLLSFIRTLLCLHFIDEQNEVQGNLVLVQRTCTNILQEGHMKYSCITDVIKGMELGLLRCPKYSIRSEKKGDTEEEKRVLKRKIVTLAWRQILLLF